MAEDECLTFSFGFRMPNVSDMMDRVSDKFSANEVLRQPLTDIIRDELSCAGEITANELAYLKDKLMAQLQNSNVLEDAIMSLMSEAKYPENIPEVEEIGTADLEQVLDLGYSLMLEPASRLLYSQEDEQTLFWANGEGLCLSDAATPIVKQLADGEIVVMDERFYDADLLEDIATLLNESIIMLLPAEDAE